MFRSVSHIYAQVIDDMSGTTLASAASTEAGAEGRRSASGVRGGNVAGAQALGKTIAERLIAKGIKRVVFDRGGYPVSRADPRGGGRGARSGAGILRAISCQPSALGAELKLEAGS